ncbi:MAG: AAA family ATPase [Bacteroidales bacterium]|jgi:shikimate kinase|nr:AAA family ATPase [Bacteroidales bacterium]
MKIFLTGFMGSGKSTIGRQISEVIGFDFLDTDLLIEREQGKTIAEIFDAGGEAAFRQLEHDLLVSLLPRDFAVISTGGGMPCFHHNMDLMLNSGKVVYLKTHPQTLAGRLIRSQTERPLIRDKTAEELQAYITARLQEREPFYRRAEIIVQTENFSLNQLLRSLNLMKS